MGRDIHPVDIKNKIWLNEGLLTEDQKSEQNLHLNQSNHDLKLKNSKLELQNIELKKSVEVLEETRNKYTMIYQDAPIGFFSLNQEGIITSVNITGAQMLGLKSENIIDRYFIHLINCDSKKIFNETLIKAHNRNEDISCNINLTRKEGDILNFGIKIKSIFGDNNNFIEYMVVLININDYMRFENELLVNYINLIKNMKDRAEDLLILIERLKSEVEKSRLSDKKIRTREKREQARSEEFAKVLDAVPAAVWISHDNKGLVITGNHLSYQYLGIPHGANASKSLPAGERPETFKVFKHGLEMPAEQMPVQLSSAGNEIRNYEFDIVYNDKKVRHMMGNATPLYDENMNPRGSVSAFIDISKHKNAEIKMAKLIKELARSNKDLEQFAYVTSHDLKEPLRMVSSFTQLLEKRYKGKMDKDADEFIEFIVDGAKSMQRLLDDLLEYSRISSGSKKFDQVNLNEVIEEITNNLKLSIEENNAQISHDPLPSVFANHTQMVQLFQNLIGNAIKFQRKTPHINISAKKKGDKYIFSVKDNGIGINSKYQDRIFKVFQRLHTRDKYDGTGIGLSITKKIVENHNGNIWLKSKPDKGSTFYFTLPSKI